MEPKSDAVNDLDGPYEPSFVPVAICIGTDLQGEPVTLVDRLCVNRPGVEKMRDDMLLCQQEMKSWRREASVASVKYESADGAARAFLAAMGLEFLVILFLSIFFLRR